MSVKNHKKKKKIQPPYHFSGLYAYMEKYEIKTWKNNLKLHG